MSAVATQEGVSDGYRLVADNGSGLQRLVPLALIIALHIGFFFAFKPGDLRPVPPATPKEIIATLLMPEPASPRVETPRPQVTPPKPTPPKPKPVPVKKQTPPPPAVRTPSPDAISTPAPVTPPPVAANPSAPSLPVAPAAPTAPAAQAAPKTVTGVQYIQPPQPDYPPMAKRMGEQGKVVLRVLVNERGFAEQIQIQQSSGSPRLDEAARQAAQKAQFRPHREDGRPVSVYALIPINFSIQ